MQVGDRRAAEHHDVDMTARPPRVRADPPLHETPPSRVLVNLVQDDERLARREMTAAQGQADLRVVPVQISGMLLGGILRVSAEAIAVVRERPRSTAGIDEVEYSPLFS